jgi:hypothetical protein
MAIAEEGRMNAEGLWNNLPVAYLLLPWHQARCEHRHMSFRSHNINADEQMQVCLDCGLQGIVKYPWAPVKREMAA